MKKLLISLSILLLLTLTLTSCTDILFGTFPSDDPTLDGGTTEPDNTEDENTGENGDDGEGGEGGEETPGGDEVVNNSPYKYEQSLPNRLPRVSVTTASKTNNFATNIVWFDQKWNNEIQYESCTITVDNTSYSFANAAAQIKVRGNYTIMFPKQPFRIKFNEKRSMLGMNDGQAYKSWVLLADWKDSSMLYNSTAYFLGNNILGSDGYYCTDYRFVELYLNGTYWGLYLLAEQQQTGTGRVDINEPAKNYMGTDIGYFFEYDGYHENEAEFLQKFPNDGDYTFEIPYYNGNAPLKELDNDAYADPSYYEGYTIKSDTYSDAQRQFIATYLENVFEAVYDSTHDRGLWVVGKDGNKVAASTLGITTAKDAVAATIDLQSLVDTYILNEICCDYDLYWSSFYMYADMSATGSGKLTFAAPWDFDTGFGSKNSAKYTTSGSRKDACETAMTNYVGNNRNPWLLLLIHEDWFMDMVREKWASLVTYKIPDKALSNITKTTNMYSTAFEKNASTSRLYRANNTWMKQVGDPSPTKELVASIAACTTQRAASERLYGWLKTRFNYLNTQWGDGSTLFE